MCHMCHMCQCQIAWYISDMVIHSNSWESTKKKGLSNPNENGLIVPIPQTNGLIQPMNIAINLYEQTNLHDGLSHLNLIIVGIYINMDTNILWLVVGLPLWKIWVSWDDDIPNWMESHKSHVPVTTNQFWYLNPFMGIRTNPNKNTKPTKPPEHQKAPQLRQAAAEAHNSRCSSTDRDHFAGAPDHLTSPHRDGGFLNSSYFGWRF